MKTKFTLLCVVMLALVAMIGVSRLAVADDADVAVVELQGNDQMQYNLHEFKVKAGQKVKLTMKNAGMLPKVAMGHNCVLLKKGVDLVQFALAANQSPPEYIPEAKKDDILAHTKLLGPGESDTIEFTAPTEAGAYDYLCTFPGHFALMKGKMIVE
ncbi:MAG: Azurin [Planctomycetes bacterium]|nr:Azurin [Planctomycetota bacterium]